MRAIQFRSEDGERHAGLIEADGEHARTLVGGSTMYETAMRALRERQSLPTLIARLATGPVIDYGRLLKEGKVLQPLDHQFRIDHLDGRRSRLSSLCHRQGGDHRADPRTGPRVRS